MLFSNNTISLKSSAIETNTKVMMHYGAANRDNEIFDNPNKFDSTRDGKKVISLVSVFIFVLEGN